MSNKFTPWFQMDNPPVRSGIYNVSCQEKNQSGSWYAWIQVNKNGEILCSSAWATTPQKAKAYKKEYGLTKFLNVKSWRGIVKE